MRGHSENPALSLGQNPQLRRAALALPVAVVLVGLLVAFSGMTLAGLSATIALVPFWVWPLIAVAQALMVVLAGWKWQMLLRDLSGGSDRIGLATATGATTLGTLAGQMLPIQIVTPAARAMIARREGVAPTRALGSSVLEQMFDLLALAVFVSAITMPWLIGAGAAAGMAIATLAALLATVLVRPALRTCARLLSLLGLAEGLAGGMRRAALLPLTSLMAPMAISILRLALVAAINVGILLVIVPGVDAGALLMMVPATQCVSAMPVVPAGLGLVEAGWTGVLVVQGIPAADAAAASLSLRIISTVPFLVVAPLLLVGLRGND